jgi:nucleoside-diphosphate-sugar epimerase
MRIVVTGATGNVGTSVVDALEQDAEVREIVGISRRRPGLTRPKVGWVQADVRHDDLVTPFRDADAVIHLAWLIQPSRDEAVLRSVNVGGTRRVLEAVATAGVPALVHASSVGAYGPGPKDRAVDEAWPTTGIESSFYARHKAECERMLDRFEREHAGVRVARLRPGLIFKREAASGIRRLFAGPFLPSPLVRRGLVPIVPRNDRLRFQAVHSLDVGEAYRLAATRDVRGAFNIAADPILDGPMLAKLLRSRSVPVHGGLLRTLADVTWRLRLQPTSPGWVDMAFAVPLLDTTRARDELGWTPRHTASEAFLELFDGLRERASIDTPPLARDSGGPLRFRELLSGIGARSR